jgi:hypothetical protein
MVTNRGMGAKREENIWQKDASCEWVSKLIFLTKQDGFGRYLMFLYHRLIDLATSNMATKEY